MEATDGVTAPRPPRRTLRTTSAIALLGVFLISMYFRFISVVSTNGSVASSTALRQRGAASEYEYQKVSSKRDVATDNRSVSELPRVTRVAWKPPTYKTKYPRGYLVEQPKCPGSGPSIDVANIQSNITEDHVMVGVTCIAVGGDAW
jgi:hypothetical protein